MSKSLVEDESEVFEITDFTTASDWERFIARLEEIIHEWKLNISEASPLTSMADVKGGSSWIWEEKVANIPFVDFNFTFTRHQLVRATTTGGRGRSVGGGGEVASGTVGSDGPSSRTGSSSAAGENTKGADDDRVGQPPRIWAELMSLDDLFPSRAHCLCRWYGLKDFIVLTTAPGMDEISSESRVVMLLSSLSVAAVNTGCQLPMFVHSHAKWRRLFAGTAESPSYRTSFEMVQLKRTPPQYNHLSGLIDVFKSKIAIPVNPCPPVMVSVRLTYLLQDWTRYSWPQLPPDFDGTGEVGVSELGDLPFGAYEDPVRELLLSATWPSLSEDMIVDDAVYSDLDPLQAPLWSVRVTMNDRPRCLLGEYLSEFVKSSSTTESTQQLLGRALDSVGGATEVDVVQALQRLTEAGPYAIPTIGQVVNRATSKLALRPDEAPIPTERLNDILLYMFPDARPGFNSIADSGSLSANSVVHKSESSLTTSSLDAPSTSNPDSQFKEMFRQLKSAPLCSMTSRLAVCMCIINHSHGGLRAVAHLWQEFVMEMRYRLENNYTIPDLELGTPNMGCNILHQKLQMLNVCIERKRSREALANARSSADDTDGTGTEDARDEKMCEDPSSDDEETFFECDDVTVASADNKSSTVGVSTEHVGVTIADIATEIGPSGAESMYSGSVSGDTDYVDSFTHKPCGRLKVLEGFTLLNVPGEPLYVPITQEPAPMTEDSLEEHAEVLAKLGTSAEGAHLRARMQSACLLSDMEAFKAANPGCILGDFVRWYSPRDWIEEKVIDDQGNVKVIGELSQRMQIPGNMWLEVWQTARPVAARKQRRLFDDTKEAEKVLHWLASMRPAEVVIKLMPMLVHSAISKLMEHDECQLPLLKKLMEQIMNKAMKATRRTVDESKHFEDLIRHLSLAEVVITRARSLLDKLERQRHDVAVTQNELRQFVNDVLEQPDVSISGAARSPIGIIVHRLLIAAHKSSKMNTDDDDYYYDEENGRSLDSDPARDDFRPPSGSFTASQSSPSRSTAPKSPSGQTEFPRPIGKEYILRVCANRPAPWSRTSPQRMYCVLMKDDFRLAGAFTTDTTFQ